ncbi:hypothetical protein B0H63DRAFT_136899 [Podospora didyma]|uniref:Uncharacterized protein n=1 Tax=Podospora didyma TaxID=330526 RepID=A0AAE0NRP7_9PEZI|nr:hypothetical protein B0H63DRAFT_136899 [Podospora didyma]
MCPRVGEPITVTNQYKDNVRHIYRVYSHLLRHEPVADVPTFYGYHNLLYIPRGPGDSSKDEAQRHDMVKMLEEFYDDSYYMTGYQNGEDGDDDDTGDDHHQVDQAVLIKAWVADVIIDEYSRTVYDRYMDAVNSWCKCPLPQRRLMLLQEWCSRY